MPDQSSSTSSFKRFLLRILLPFIAIISVAGIAFNYVFERMIIFNSQTVGAYKVNRILKETYPNEIPIFGSSRAEGGFIPDSLGDNYFNYGLSGTKYDVTLFFLEEECRKKKANPWIILNLDLDGLYYGIGDIANYVPNSDNAVVRALLKDKYQPVYRIPFVKYYGMYEGYFRDYLNNRMQLTKMSNKGSAIEKKVLTEKQFAELVEQRKHATEVFNTDTTLVQKLDDLIDKHPDRFFIFVVSPYHSSYFAKYANMPAATAFLTKLNSRKNLRVFDFSKLELADTLYFNTSHLNYRGAAAFNHRLKDSLASVMAH